MIDELLIFAAAFGISAALTRVIRHYALARGLLDTPNQRSSHVSPTPRGGGLAVVLTFLAAAVYFFARAELPIEILLALAIGGGAIAAIGFADDHGHVPAPLRFFVHVAAAISAVLLIAPEILIQFGSTAIATGLVGEALTVLAIAWFINLFNFMDGIDGIAGGEAVFVSFGAALIVATGPGATAGMAPQFSGLLLGFGAACLGFLVWNWPPASIFLGDVGSGFFGFVIACLAAATTAFEILPLWTWLILTGVFFVDATYTLIRRMLAGDRWVEAHRSHAYQRAARRWGSHRLVTSSVLIVNIAWLFPLAWLSARRPEWGAWLWIVAWAPLVLACRMLGAGRSDEA